MPEKTAAGRPTSGRALLTEIARIRCTPEDVERWRAAAVGARRSLSDWLRIAADTASSTVRLTAQEFAPGFDPDRVADDFSRWPARKDVRAAKKAKRKLSSTGRRSR